MSLHQGAIDDHEVPRVPLELLVARMKSHIAEADLDCRCRAEIESSLDGFADENAEAAFCAALSQARAMREAVQKLLGFLAEIEELDAREADITAFAEMAGVFDDICRAAEGGAAAMRAAVVLHPRMVRRKERYAS